MAISSFQDLLQKYVNEDYSTLVGLAKASVADILPKCAEIDKDNKGMLLLMSIALSGIGADSKASPTEVKFLADVLGIDANKVVEILAIIVKNPTSLELAKKFVGISSTAIKASTINFIATLCACDETITRDEGAYILSLMAE